MRSSGPRVVDSGLQIARGNLRPAERRRRASSIATSSWRMIFVNHLMIRTNISTSALPETVAFRPNAATMAGTSRHHHCTAATWRRAGNVEASRWRTDIFAFVRMMSETRVPRRGCSGVTDVNRNLEARSCTTYPRGSTVRGLGRRIGLLSGPAAHGEGACRSVSEALDEDRRALEGAGTVTSAALSTVSGLSCVRNAQRHTSSACGTPSAALADEASVVAVGRRRHSLSLAGSELWTWRAGHSKRVDGGCDVERLECLRCCFERFRGHQSERAPSRQA